MAKIQVQGIGVYDDKILKKKIIDMANSLSKLAKKGEWSKSSENGIRALGRMWQAYQDWSRQNESITEGPDADLGKKLKQIQNQIYKLGHQYKSKANVPAMMRSFMLGVQNQLKKDKLTEGPQRDMNNMALYIIDLNKELSLELKKGGKLIFIRHAYAPGGGDPENFDINNCDTQRNLSEEGRNQAKKIGNFFKDNDVQIFKVFSSEWCRCKETAKLAFTNFETKDFLNSFFSAKFANNKNKQMLDLKNYVKKFKGNENLIFVTHYVVISEALDYAPSSGEIVISDKNFNKIGSIEIDF